MGTAGADRLTGTGRRDVIFAGAGNDVVQGQGGADVICDPAGNDRASGGAGADLIDGGRGNDRLSGGGGDDALLGRAGADVIAGGGGNDRLVGERGNDILRGDAGDDRLDGGAGRDRCAGGPGTEVFRACESRDAPGPSGGSPTFTPPGLQAPTPPGLQSPTPPGSQSPTPPAPPSDQPPVAVNDAATVAEDSAAQEIPVLANDTDPDGGPKSLASATQPANGTVQIGGGGAGLTYRPNANYCNEGAATDNFTYTLAPGGSSATVAVRVTCANEAPMVGTTAGAVAYTEGDPATTVDGGLTVTDADDSTLEGATVRISLGFQAGDDLVFGNQPGISGAYNSGTGVLTLTGTASVADYQTAMRSIGFRSTNLAPVTSKTVEFKVNDGDTDSNAATKEMAVTPVNASPQVSAGGTLSYTENDPATAVHPGLTVSEPEGEGIGGGSASITANYQAGQDLLNWTDNNLADNVTLDAINSSQQTIVLTGMDTAANYQAALRAITYRNNSENPATVSRTVTFSASDVLGAPGSDTRTIAVTSVDDPPDAVADSATALEDAAATATPVLANDADVDGGPKTISSAGDPANGTVVLTGGSPGAHTGLTYQPDPNYCNDPPGTAPDTFTYTLNGGSTATVSMTVTCVNDAPVADDEAFSGNDSAHGNTTMVVNDPDDGAPNPSHPNTTISGDILAGDTDVDGPGPLTVTPGTFVTSDGGMVTIQPDGDFSFNPAASTSCTDTSDFFDYTVEDSGSPGQTDTGRVTIAIAGCVWYVSNNAAGNAGTSLQPFDTLAQAETASAANHTVFVFDGDNTTTGYTTGYALNAGERLIGEHEGLVVDPDQSGALTADTLHTANPGAHPTLTASNEDVVDLDDGNEVRGFNIDPQGDGGGIAGATGDTGGGTIDDVNVDDNGPLGSQPGIELDSTTGTFEISNTTVDNGGSATATGVRLNSAGTVNFAPAGTISITTAGARGLDATGPTTDMGTSTFDAVSVTGSGNGGVSMLNTTGTTTFGDLSLTTTSGATPAFQLNNAGTVSVPGAGSANISATGGPAVDVTGTSGATLDFDAVSSTGSANDGINLAGLGTGTFSATSGDITNATGIAFDLDGGSGAVTYPGALNNSGGATVEITGRSNGAVTLSGAIADTNDASGGILLLGNSGGSTTFSNASKVLNTAGAPAVSVNSSDGHTLTLSGGGLDIDTTTGPGITAASSGTLNVTGSANTIDTTTGTALNVTNTDVGATPLTFQRISANGASRGIQLSNTGPNNALTVQGTGAGTCTHLDQSGCTGGRIQNSAGADDSGATPAGTGIVLNSTRGISLTRMHIHDHTNYGIRGTNVVGFTLANSVVNGTNGTDTAFLPDKEGSIRFSQLTGTVSVTDTAVSGGANNNVIVQNTAGTLNSTFTNLRSGALNNASAEDAVTIEGTGTATANATVQSSTFTNAPADIFHYIGDGTGGGALNFTGNTITNNHPTIVTGGVTLAGGANGTTTMTVQNNTMRDSHAAGLDVNKSSGTGSLTAAIGNNQIGMTGVANSGSLEGNGIDVTSGQGNATYNVTNNVVRQYNSHGMVFRAGTGTAGQSGTVNLNLSGNTVQEPGDNPNITLLQGIRVESGISATDTFQTCVNIGPNTVTGSSDAPDKDWRVLGAGQTTVRLPGYAGGSQDDAAATTFINGKFGGGANGVASSDGSSAWSGAGTTCP